MSFFGLPLPILLSSSPGLNGFKFSLFAIIFTFASHFEFLCVFAFQELLELLLIPKLGVTGTAQCLEIFYVVGFLATSHSPRFNVMDVNRSCSTYLARDEVADVIAEVIEVCQGVFLHLISKFSSLNMRWSASLAS